MNLFTSKNQTLSLELITDYLGNDSRITDKVHQGEQKGLFELGLHGWNHVDYSQLSEQEQKETLLNANTKMQKLFGNKSDILITPFDTFNNNTNKAMSQIWLGILSSNYNAESNLDQNKSVYIADGKSHNNETKQTVYHLPGTISYKYYQNGKWIKNPLKMILATVDNIMAKYGYVIIVLHTQNFAKVDQNEKSVNVVDLNELKDLSQLINSLISQNIQITPFYKKVGIQPMALTPSLRCSTDWYITRYFTPLESEYKGTTMTVDVDGIARDFYKAFLSVVKVEGWGKTKQGDYLGYYDGSYHSSLHPLNSEGNPLAIGDIATDPTLIPIGTRVNIPTLPSPWNNKVFNATDTGPAIKGRHIDVYIGLGKMAKQETKNFGATALNNTVCY
jgi:3D (Asp-Asp-Asp) domain-containing protein/peptidoglycan/xylan/chitin deacetylase (PgdA/CDA1 family)